MRSDTTPDSADALDVPVPAGNVRCDACPVLCIIRPGKTGACDRYANVEGKLARVDPLVIAQRVIANEAPVVRFLDRDWQGEVLADAPVFVTGVGSGTTYPDYKPAPFIVSSVHQGVDMVTVVTEGIFSYCGVKVKIDTDRFLGPEQSAVRIDGEQIGHVTTAEYGSQMLALGGVRHLTGGSKKRRPRHLRCPEKLCNREAGRTGDRRRRESGVAVGRSRPSSTANPRRACGWVAAPPPSACSPSSGSATSDEVIVVDDHITGVLTEHQAGRFLTCARPASRSAVASPRPGATSRWPEPGTGWGGTDITDPLEIIEHFDPGRAWPGLRLLMVSTTGEHAAWFVLDDQLQAAAGAAAALPSQSAVDAHRRELRARAVHRAVHGRVPAAACAPASPRIRCGSRAR